MVCKAKLPIESSEGPVQSQVSHVKTLGSVLSRDEVGNNGKALRPISLTGTQSFQSVLLRLSSIIMS